MINMKVLDPGHSYLVHQYDAHPDAGFIESNITFMKRNEPSEKYPGNTKHHPGTNCQEVLRVLIDIIKYLDNQDECTENETILYKLRHSLLLFEVRNANIKGIKWKDPLPLEVEDIPTCRICGHWFCEEH